MFSTKTMKPLAVLKYHRERLDCLDFAVIQNQTESTASKQSYSTLPGEDSNSASVQTSEAPNAGDSPNTDNDGTSEEDSDMEDVLEERRQWSRRHWIAVGGKENRISLWEIY